MQLKELSKRHIVFMYDDIFEGMYLNLHLILAEHRNYLIDTGLGSAQAQDILDYIRTHNAEKELVVINTHYHWDHIWGNGAFPDSLIVSHIKCHQLLVEHWDTMAEKWADNKRGTIDKKLPNLLFEQALYFPADGIRIFHAPGHGTDDCSVYDEQEQVLNVGDNIGDTPESPLPELSISKEEYLQSLALYEVLEITQIVSGHNQIQNKGFLKKIRDALYE